MIDIPKRKLGRTGLNVTALGFGVLELRGIVAGVGRELKPKQPERILNAVLAAGINYIDVAVEYGEAAVELQIRLTTVLPNSPTRLQSLYRISHGLSQRNTRLH